MIDTKKNNVFHFPRSKYSFRHNTIFFNNLLYNEPIFFMNVTCLDNLENNVISSSKGVVANVLDCDIVVSVFELQLCDYIHFQANALEWVWNFLLPQLWVQEYHYLAPNNPLILICH